MNRVPYEDAAQIGQERVPPLVLHTLRQARYLNSDVLCDRLLLPDWTRVKQAAKDALLFHWPGVAEDRLRAPFSSTQGSSLFFFQSLLDDSPNVAWY